MQWTYSLVYAADVPFHVCDQAMNPRKNLYRILPRVNKYRLMFTLANVQNDIRMPPISTAYNILFKLIFEGLGDLLSTYDFQPYRWTQNIVYLLGPP